MCKNPSASSCRARRNGPASIARRPPACTSWATSAASPRRRADRCIHRDTRTPPRPSRRGGPGLIGALVEVEHRTPGVGGGTGVAVAQHGQVAAATRHPLRGLRPQRVAGQPTRLRCGVGVERRLRERVVAEPEPEADDLPGVRLPRDRVHLPRLVDLPVGEPGDCDVEGVPEMMHRADLPGIPSGELLQCHADLGEHPPIAGHPRGIVGPVLGVLGERPPRVGQTDSGIGGNNSMPGP